MRDSDGINRRDLIVKTAGAASATSALASMTPAMAQKSQPLPPSSIWSAGFVGAFTGVPM